MINTSRCGDLIQPRAHHLGFLLSKCLKFDVMVVGCKF